MTENPPATEVSRLVACRSCGNRVARTARRCPACGAQDPSADKPAEPRPRQHRSRHASADRSRWIARVVVVAAALAVGILTVLLIARVSARRAEHAPAAEVTTPAVVETPAVVAAPVTVVPDPPTPEPSRSRGRREWPFFFKPGDRLARMGDAKPLGYIITMVKDHKFGDGTVGPAYMLWTPAGNEEAFDADELERTAKME
ncbi:MAG: hypothetical protein ABW216_00600 [Candidatus Rokuibacteriota bacterium]|jgi:hypothetical protein|nr:hypothetical protein [Patescibacteria group bacterium]